MPWSLKGKPRPLVLSLGLLLALASVDYMTGLELDLFLFYYVPVAITAWFVRRVSAVLMAILATGVWAWVNVVSGQVHSSWFFWYWNSSLQCASLIIIALAVSRIKQDLEREWRLNAELSKALGQVKQLKGLLPICAWCKKIRDDQGYWKEVETYISQHSEAEFTHGICPACKEKHLSEWGKGPM
jgi:hypothetical protein